MTEQPPYSMLVRGIEEDVLSTVRRHGMGTLTYSPLAGGWLSGRWRKEAAGSPTSSARFDMSTPANQRKLDLVEQLALLADQAGMSLIEMAIAFGHQSPGRHRGDRRATDDAAARFVRAGRRSHLADGCSRPDRPDRRPGVTVNPDDNS